jgi:hypothetical protein
MQFDKRVNSCWSTSGTLCVIDGIIW